MKKRIFFLVIIIFALFQATILDFFKIWNVKPDLLLACAVFSGLFFELKYALLFGLWSGFLKDALSLNTLALNIFYFPALAFLTNRLAKKIPIETIPIRMVLIFVSVVLVSLLNKFFQSSGENYITWGIYFRVTLLESLYTALVSSLIFKIMR
ncbi:MAG: rod shape-determining protein MreD [Candidatus Omnitrophica bacterium]|nr:rod shape-determining protein MreD [Candidatus Omnitrophota bacterium]